MTSNTELKPSSVLELWHFLVLSVLGEIRPLTFWVVSSMLPLATIHLSFLDGSQHHFSVVPFLLM